MPLTKDQVKHVAKLANLPLTSEEEEKYSRQLSKILEYVEQLEKVDTLQLRSGQAAEVEPTFNVSGLKNVTGKDEVGTCLTRQDALANSPKIKNNYFVTKGVFEEK